MRFKAFLLLLLSFSVSAAYLDEDTGEVVVPADSELLGMDSVNYGDPTASYSGIGVQQSKDNTTASFVYGGGRHILSADIGTNWKGDINYRAKYFNVNHVSGFGWSVDILGDKSKDDLGGSSNKTVLVGLVQKFDVTENIIIVPMIYGGKTFSSTASDQGEALRHDSWLAQGGAYAMYGFDEGHWIYANPKMTYVDGAKKWASNLELGAGYMVADNQSVGLKFEHNRFAGRADSVGSINYFYYF